ncbi:radical SAM protein [Alicyclobacillus sp. SO9]|uniref:radical SAM protein n=1 Tax=Alicyclobacillus sp. SO9 TaxID=2665646 RepID=UPI0018E898DE|nr:radical SAM protein [Alicyclobacillus sp. SO9]QQE80356.1 radical SAM protein [Alicyclobacillus sp. SO9]
MTTAELGLTTEQLSLKLPMVEVFETIEGEGTAAGFPTTFVRLFNCNLRCTWCDTPYSYAPAQPEYFAAVGDIVAEVGRLGHQRVCLTGGEPLLYTEKVLVLIEALARLPLIQDVHIETNGAIDLTPFIHLRNEKAQVREKVRFILDYKLPKSGEQDRMLQANYGLLGHQDEIKFVIADDEDFDTACKVVEEWVEKGTVLFSPVWETMPPQKLVAAMLEKKLHNVKLNLQLHKIIWDPDMRGV